ncbi:MAG TPA: HAMP domain-containing sensor histidine kinase [Noviherbaspirillum sp.]|nr:HAMP domain-containing sensor histidine kinase [Noviherbaspirillum sp.]
MEAGLAAIIVHDIKNALSVLEGELRGLTVTPDRERAQQAHGACLGLQDKLIGFLTLYKASSQGLVARIDSHCPEDFLHAIVRESSVGKPGITVSINAHGMPVIGFFDEVLVGLALEAALQNAMRFARCTIELGCRQEDDALVFSMRDDGPGIGAKEDTSSTGLGMNLCNAIAEAHHKDGKKGSALLANHAEGGALFQLRLY